MDQLEETKDEKLKKLVETGLINAAEDFKNLSKDQIDFLIGKVDEIKNAKKPLTEEEIDLLKNSKTLDTVLKEQLSNEIVKRRNAEQQLQSLKNNVGQRARDLAALVAK